MFLNGFGLCLDKQLSRVAHLLRLDNLALPAGILGKQIPHQFELDEVSRLGDRGCGKPMFLRPYPRHARLLSASHSSHKNGSFFATQEPTRFSGTLGTE